jgi:hypothetical protein
MEVQVSFYPLIHYPCMGLICVVDPALWDEGVKFECRKVTVRHTTCTDMWFYPITTFVLIMYFVNKNTISTKLYYVALLGTNLSSRDLEEMVNLKDFENNSKPQDIYKFMKIIIVLFRLFFTSGCLVNLLGICLNYISKSTTGSFVIYKPWKKTLIHFIQCTIVFEYFFKP